MWRVPVWCGRVSVCGYCTRPLSKRSSKAKQQSDGLCQEPGCASVVHCGGSDPTCVMMSRMHFRDHDLHNRFTITGCELSCLHKTCCLNSHKLYLAQSCSNLGCCYFIAVKSIHTVRYEFCHWAFKIVAITAWWGPMCRCWLDLRSVGKSSAA